jgi:fluoride exporter
MATTEPTGQGGQSIHAQDPPPIHQGETLEETIAAHASRRSASSLASVDRPPSKEEGLTEPKVYAPLSIPVLALLAPASIFGVLARLGLQALATYDGNSIFPLAYPQTIGCFVMGFCLSLKEPIGQLSVYLRLQCDLNSSHRASGMDPCTRLSPPVC